MDNLVARVAALFLLLAGAGGQREPRLPLSPDSFRQIYRIKQQVPKGRSATLGDVFIRIYSANTTVPTAYRFKEAKKLLDDPALDLQSPTVVYAHGYVELATDVSVSRMVKSYLKHGEYNVLVLDWANMGFGAYFAVALDLKPMGVLLGRALAVLLKQGLSLEGLHLIGHSMGAHLVAFAARELDAKGYRVPRLTGLDPAYPGFYPSLLSVPMSADDADFVDAIHTDGGAYGAPGRTAQADFWPNGGYAKQPGCTAATVPLTVEDFCSHWRSWEYWAESVNGGEFLARPCEDHDAFLRGRCKDASTVYMGLQATKELSGNYYLRTAAKEPYALAERGAD
ncbi:lipase domain-containing protein [Phthorimaea operculella]|nr:lipase domain-containing protein [Phthorimaea operculella]